ncbi:SRPBCC family protein [Streptomyces sp. NPDC002763]|uniref:SRPBCC family protein n=1 Tax=Streptomyces sp. NPDC002763 TaxID=3154427 RepID=UPI003331D703
MADKERDNNHEESSGLDLLREQVVDYLGAQVGHLADKAGDKLGDVTDHLLDSAEGGGGGMLAGVGGRMLKGDSPLKAFVGQKAKGLKDNVVGKVKSIFGGGGGGKAGSTKVMNIIEVLDVGVPIRTAYNYWSQYDEFSGFTKGVRSVSKNDEVASTWKVKVGPSTRGWKASVEEQVPDERIVWSSEGAKGTTHGCVSFHEITPDLTRIVLVVEYYPSGFFEKTGNLWRAQGRRLRLDFKNFQRYVTFADEEVEGWRGEIRDGEVVRSHEEALEEEEAAGEAEDQEEYDEEEDGEAPEEEEEADEADEEDEGDEEEEDEEYDEEEPEGEYDEEADENKR